MLSAFLNFMNRERALSFSAALCLLTLSAAVMPTIFQEDNPFENTSLWEGSAEQAESFVSASSSTLSEAAALEEEIEPIDFDYGEAATDEFESAPGLESNSEIEFEDGFAEQSTPLFESDTEQLEVDEIQTPGMLDIGDQSPTLEPGFEGPEFEEPESEAGVMATTDVLEFETEVEAPSAVNQPEVSNLESELATEATTNLSDPQLEPEGNLVGEVVTQESSQELLLEQPAGAQDENVFQGEFWSPPLTSELQSKLEPHIIPPAGATDLLPDADAQEIVPIPPMPYPEFDWSQAQPAQLQHGQFGSTEAQIGEAVIPCLLYTSPSPRDATLSRMPSSA